MIYPNLTFRPTLRVLSEEQIAELHSATLEVLERTGVRLTHPKAREVLAGAGARIRRRARAHPILARGDRPSAPRPTISCWASATASVPSFWKAPILLWAQPRLHRVSRSR